MYLDIIKHVKSMNLVTIDNKPTVLIVAKDASFKVFKEHVINTAAVKVTKRYDPQRVYDNSIRYMVRDQNQFKGKHVNFLVVTETGKTNLYRKPNGQYIKVEASTNV